MEPVRLGQEEFSVKHLEILQKDNLFPAWWKLPELSQQAEFGLQGNNRKLPE
jgi:hypothetical protein